MSNTFRINKFDPTSTQCVETFIDDIVEAALSAVKGTDRRGRLVEKQVREEHISSEEKCSEVTITIDLKSLHDQLIENLKAKVNLIARTVDEVEDDEEPEELPNLSDVQSQIKNNKLQYTLRIEGDLLPHNNTLQRLKQSFDKDNAGNLKELRFTTKVSIGGEGAASQTEIPVKFAKARQETGDEDDILNADGLLSTIINKGLPNSMKKSLRTYLKKKKNDGDDINMKGKLELDWLKATYGSTVTLDEVNKYMAFLSTSRSNQEHILEFAQRLLINQTATDKKTWSMDELYLIIILSSITVAKDRTKTGVQIDYGALRTKIEESMKSNDWLKPQAVMKELRTIFQTANASGTLSVASIATANMANNSNDRNDRNARNNDDYNNNNRKPSKKHTPPTQSFNGKKFDSRALWCYHCFKDKNLQKKGYRGYNQGNITGFKGHTSKNCPLLKTKATANSANSIQQQLEQKLAEADALRAQLGHKL